MILITNKTCFKCGAEKPRTEFYKHSRMADGLLGKCKECTKADVKLRAQTNPTVQEYDRNRPNAKQRNLDGGAKVKARRAIDPEYAAKLSARSARYKHPAHHAVSNAIRGGKLIKPETCQHCEASDESIQGHHWSYEEPHWLDVIWLCVTCHNTEHKRLRSIGRDV